MGDIVITPASNDVNSTAGTLNIRTSDSYPMLLKTSNVERISITAAGLVGIGTTAPTGKLHIYSSITGDTLIRADGTNGTIFSVTDDLSNSLLSVNNSAGLPVLEVFADDSVVMGQYGSGDLVVRNNKVGIGTTSPNRLLEIKGSNSAPLRLNTSLGNCAIEFLTSPSTYSWLVGGQYSVNNSFEITPSTAVGGTTFSTPSIVVKSDGTVGIGITNPNSNYKLDLSSSNDGYARQWIASTAFVGTDNGTNGFQIRVLGGGTNGLKISNAVNNVEYVRISSDGNVGIGTTSPSGKLSVDSVGANSFNVCDSFSSNVRVSVGTINTAGTTYGLIQTYQHNTNSAGVSPLNIQPFGGNVGIGLTNPTEKLHVTGYILTRSRLAYTQRNDVVKNGLSFYVDFNNKTCFDPIISATSIKDISNNNYSLSLVNAATISNKDGNTALYTANNSSYLQISSYDMALPHTWEAWVNGDAYGTGGSGWDTIWDSNTERPLIGVINGVLNVYPNTNNCGTLTAGKWYHIVVTADASSNIVTFINGVQTASFAYVSTFATGTRNIWLGGDVSAETFNGYIPIARTYNRVLSATEVMQNYNAEKWRFDNSSSFYHNVADGTVGLSTTTPSHKLHVYARGNGAGILIESDPTDNANQAPALKLYPKSTDASERNWSISPFRNYAQSLSISSSDSKGGDPYSNATTRLIIDGINGNVGIGTINPAYKLDVSGGSVRVFNNPATNNWGLTIENTNAGGWGVSQYFRLYGYNSTPAAAFDVLQIVGSYPGYGQADFFVKSQAQSAAADVMSLLGNGRVGIGTNTPTTLLSVGGPGSTSAASGITFGGDAQANLYRIGEDSIKTDGNLYVAGDTILQGNKYLTNFKSVFIFARGTGANNSAGRYLLMNSTLVYDNTSRGLRLTIINATNLAVVSNTDYDTYGSDAACNDLATAINGMTSQQIGILTSFDAWERDNTNLKAAALNVGLTKLGTYSTGAAIRKPYAAIFNGTSDTANATTKHVIERMESSDADATRALITTYLTTDGTYASIDAALHMPNALYASDADIEYPIVAVNSVGNVGIGTTAAGTKLEVYGVLRVTESSSGGILQLSAGASNVDIASTFYGGSRRPITFTVDSERVRIDAAGRVGIGTNNPVAYLHVTGQTFLNNVVASTARNQLTINTNGANYAHFYDVGVSANNALAIGGNGAIGTVPTKAIMSWRLSTENVGIGLTNPEATSALHIKNIDAAAKVTIESADASESYINFSAQSSEYSVGFVRDGSNVNSLRFCNADSLSANEVMRLQNTNVGIGTNNPIFGLDVYKDTFRSLSRVSEKIITVSFPHNVANQKVDIIFDLTPGTNVFWGNLEVEITDGYSNQLATGKLIKVFALGLNPATGAGPYSPSLFDNTSYYTAAYGAVADNYAIDGIFFNTTTGKYYFTIIHRTSTGNVPAIKIKGFTVDVARSVNINSLTASAVYTTNTTVYYKPVVETLQSRIGFNGNINQSADLLVRGLVGLGTTNPSSRLVLGSNFASVTGITVSTDDFLESQFVARKAASKCAFGVLAWEAEAYLSAGIYYNNGNWQQHNANNNNLLFVLVPGGGVNWYASNNGSPSWNVTEALNLWDQAGRWKSSIQSARAENSYILSGNVGIGTTNPTQKLDIVGSYAAPDDDAGILKIRGAGVGPTQLNFGVSADGGYGWIQTTDIAVSNEKNIILGPLGGNVGIGTTNPLSLLGVGAAGSTTAANGLTFGQDAQANLYRVAEDTIRTDGSFIAVGNLTVGNSITASSEYRMGLYLGYVATYPSIATAAYRWIILGPYNDTLTVAGNGLRVRGELFFSRGSNGENLRNARLKVCIGQGYNKDLLHADVLSIDSDSTTEQPILYSVYLNGFTSKYFAIDAAQLVSFSPSSLDAATVYYNGQFYDQSNDARSLTIQANASITGAIGVVSKGGKIANALFAHTGNIGIGISVPSAKLEVNGPVFIPSTNGLYLGGTAGSFSSWHSVQYANGGYHVISSNGLVINNAGYSASPINAFTILTNTYDVGLSTNAPAERLHVYKTGLANNSTNSLLLLDGKFTAAGVDSNDIVGIAFRVENSAGGAQRTTSVASSYQAGYNALLLQHQGGNVGIGTTDPAAKLDIRQTSASTALKVFTNDTSTAYIAQFIGYDNVLGDTTRMVVRAGGNVGIGTTNPTAKLVVMGEDIYNYAKSSVPTAIVADSVPEFLIGSTDNIDGEEITLRMGTVLSSYYTHGAYIKAIQGAGVDYYKLAFGTSNGAAATTKMTIANDGNVGIGATNPLSKLYVEGGSADWNETTPGTAVGTIHLDPGVATDNYGNAITFGASDNANGTAAQAGIYTRSDGGYGTRMYLATTDSYAAGSKTRILINHDGNVCIGAASPQSKLDVRGTLSVYQSANSDYIYFDHAGVNTWRTRVTTDNTSSYIIGTDAPGVAFANKLFTITNAGRIGIGVVSPATLLGVGGAGSATAASGITFGGDSVANLYRISASRIKTDGFLTIDGGGGGATNLLLNRSSSSNENGMAFTTAGSVDWYYYVDNGTTNLQIQRGTEIDSAPRVRFNGANSDILFNLGGGNIGVGIANPTGKLHIYSTITGQTLIRADGTNGTIFSVVDDLSNSLLSVNNSAGIPVLEVFADDSIVMGQYGSGDLVVTNNKVGIGTTNPTNKLSVIGGASIGSSYNVSAPANGLIVQGTVGIGLTNPTQKLHVKSSVGQDGVMIDALQYSEVAYKVNGSAIKAYAALSSIAGGYVVGSSANSFIIRNDTDIFMTADAGVTSNITIKNDGKVGIGITNPSRRLHVDGGNSTTVGIYLDATGINGTDLEQSIDAFRFQVRDSIPAIFYTNNTERMRISNDGNVGIGNVAPNGARVHVKGDGSVPVLRVETALIEGPAGGTAGRTLKGWLPIMTGVNATDKVYIPLYGALP